MNTRTFDKIMRIQVGSYQRSLELMRELAPPPPSRRQRITDWCWTYIAPAIGRTATVIGLAWAAHIGWNLTR
jgi:hypothetical protein